jgi:hypothetical protein
MIGPVSGTGRTMMASLQQAMQKGMPPDQAIQYVKSMATQGIAPLADLYAMMKQFERLKQQPVQPPQTPPTIRDELNMMEQMQAQGGMSPQMPPQMPQQMPPQMAQGLGSMNAGAMENPSFAGGGIVAFDEGGKAASTPYEFNDELSSRVPSFMTGDMDIVSFVKRQLPNFDMLTPEQKQEVLLRFEPAYKQARAARLKLESRGVAEQAPPAAASAALSAAPINMRQSFAAMGAPNPFATEDEVLQNTFSQLATRPAETAPAPETPRAPAPRREVATGPKEDPFAQFRYERPDLEAIRKEREERQKTQKTGAYSQADADLAAYMAEQKKQGGDTKEAYRNFWVMTGASLMANKSPNFLQALGESVKENYGGLIKDLKQLKDENKTLRLEEIRLRQARERALETGDAADQSRYDALQQRFETRQYDIFKTELGIQEKALDRGHAERLASLRATGNEKQADRLIKLWQAANAETDPYKKQQMLNNYQAELDITREITEASTASGVSAGIRAETAGQQRLANLSKDDQIYRNAQRIVQSSQDPQEVQQAKELIRIKEQQALGMMGAGPRVAQDEGLTGGAYTGPYSTSGW